MPQPAPRNPATERMLTEEQLDAEKAQIAGLLEGCARRAMTLSSEPAYGVCWRAVMLHLLKTRFTSLESVRSAGRHFVVVLARTQENIPTRADKQALRGLYPVSLSSFRFRGSFGSARWTSVFTFCRSNCSRTLTPSRTHTYVYLPKLPRCTAYGSHVSLSCRTPFKIRDTRVTSSPHTLLLSQFRRTSHPKTSSKRSKPMPGPASAGYLPPRHGRQH